MSLWTVSVVTLAGDQADVPVAPSSTANEVLVALGEFVAAESGMQLALFHGEHELSWGASLAEFGVSDGSTLTLVRTILTEAQQKANNEALIQAAKQGELEEVKRLLCQAGVNASIVVGQYGMTPLHSAALNGHLEVVKRLVQEAQVDVNAKENNRQTPLHKASYKGHLEVVRCLVQEAGANADAADDERGTPLHVAVFYGHLQVVKWLVVEAHADINVKDDAGKTPLSDAQMMDHHEIADFLRSNGGTT